MPKTKCHHLLSHTVFSLVLITTLLVALRAPLLDIPFERDEGEYAYIAWRLDYGELPYRDWFDQKPPAVFWVYRLALSLPFDPIRSVHLTGAVFALASAVGMYFISRRLVGKRWGTATALLFAALAADPLIQGTAANTELFMLLPIIAGNWIYYYSVRGRHRGIAFMFAVGVANGIAIAFKQVALANWLFLVAVSPFMLPSQGWLRRMSTFIFWSALGIASFWGLIAGYFYINGALSDLVYNVFTHNFDYVRALSIAERLNNLENTLSTLAKSQAVIWIFALAGLTAACLRRNKTIFFFVTGWLVSGMVGASASGYYFPHYFQQMLPALAVLAIFGVKVMHEADFFGRVPSLGRIIICATAVAILPCYTVYPFIFNYTPQEAVRRIYPGNRFDKMLEYANLISSFTKEEDRLYIFGAEPEILFYARRVSATRYIFLFPLYGLYEDALVKQQETVREIIASRPTVVVYLPNTLFYVPGSEQYLTHWTDSFLARNYVAQAFIAPNSQDDFVLFMIKR